MKHILKADQFSRDTLERIFHTSAAEVAECDPFVLATLFYEPSTRTRLSFESAALRLGGGVITVENATASSSTTKGESLEDTIKVVGNYADIIVLRHPEMGAAQKAAEVAAVPIINAGDGIGSHPTQALTDAYTIWREKGRIDGNRVLIWGDLENARTINSFIAVLNQFDVEVVKQDIFDFPDINEIGKADVIYMTRPQTERSLKREGVLYGMEEKMLPDIKEDAIIMHPLPRTQELPNAIEQDKRAVYFKQVAYGLQIRKTLLATSLDSIV